MSVSDSAVTIDPIQLQPNLMYFYWGRHPQHASMDMKLGGGAFVIFEGNEAVMLDSMNLAGHGSFVRDYMEKEHGITRLTLVNTHWHEDHIAENQVFADCTIIAHNDTRRLMLEHKAQLEQGSPGVPPFKVVLPSVCFSGRLDIWCGGTKIELHEFAIHEYGHIAAYLPEQKILLAADMLEDPVWYFSFDVASPEKQIAEYSRMATFDTEHIYTVHGDVNTQRHGGYSKHFIQANSDYLQHMVIAAKEKSAADFLAMPLDYFIGEELNAAILHWWEVYREVHEQNKQALLAYLNLHH